MMQNSLDIVKEKKNELDLANKKLNEILEQRNKTDQDFTKAYKNYMNNCTIKELFETYNQELFNSVPGHWRDVSKSIEFRLEEYGYKKNGPLAVGIEETESYKRIILQIYRRDSEWEKKLEETWEEYFTKLDYFGMENFFENLFNESGVSEINLKGQYLSFEEGTTFTRYLEKTITQQNIKSEIQKMLSECQILEEKYAKDLNKYMSK